MNVQVTLAVGPDVHSFHIKCAPGMRLNQQDFTTSGSVTLVGFLSADGDDMAVCHNGENAVVVDLGNDSLVRDNADVTVDIAGTMRENAEIAVKNRHYERKCCTSRLSYLWMYCVH